MAQNDRNKPVYTIGVAADLTGVHPQTLRFYDQKGLVVPQRTGGNTRMYSEADIERLELINELTDEGINLAGVIRILDLRERLDVRDQEIDDLHKRVRRLADRVHELETRASISSLSGKPAKATDVTDDGIVAGRAVALGEGRREGTSLAIRTISPFGIAVIEDIENF